MATEKETPARAELVRHDTTTGEIERASSEVGTNAAVARARAEVEAPYTIARYHPRSWLDVRTKLCGSGGELERPAFAKACVFSRVQGRKQDKHTGQWVDNIIEGLSIRFAERVKSLAGNMQAGKAIEFDDEDKRIYRVVVVDLETNAIGFDSIVVEKTVERSKKGAEYRTIKDQRQNVAGDDVFICYATEDEITLKANNAAAKARRNLILELMPADIKDECFSKAQEMRGKSIAEDPRAEQKAIADAFAELGVYPVALEEYLGHALEASSPAELAMLRGFYVAIDQGEATWLELVGERGKPEAEQPKTTKGKKLAAELQKKTEERKAAEKAEAEKKKAGSSATSTPGPSGKK
jgi:hypothetical protein